MNPYESPHQSSSVIQRQRYSMLAVAAFSLLGYVAPFLIFMGYDCLIMGATHSWELLDELFVHLHKLASKTSLVTGLAFFSTQFVCMILFGFLAYAFTKQIRSVRLLRWSYCVTVAALTIGSVLGYRIMFVHWTIRGAADVVLAIVWFAVLAIAAMAVWFEFRRLDPQSEATDEPSHPPKSGLRGFTN